MSQALGCYGGIDSQNYLYSQQVIFVLPYVLVSSPNRACSSGRSRQEIAAQHGIVRLSALGPSTRARAMSIPLWSSTRLARLRDVRPTGLEPDLIPCDLKRFAARLSHRRHANHLHNPPDADRERARLPPQLGTLVFSAITLSGKW